MAAEFDENQKDLLAQILKKQMDGDPWKERVIPIASIAVAALSVLSTVAINSMSTESSRWEATVQTKVDSYKHLMSEVDRLFYDSRDREILASEIRTFNSGFHQIDLFLTRSGSERLAHAKAEFVEVIRTPSDKRDDGYLDRLVNSRENIRLLLLEELGGKGY